MPEKKVRVDDFQLDYGRFQLSRRGIRIRLEAPAAGARKAAVKDVRVEQSSRNPAHKTSQAPSGALVANRIARPTVRLPFCIVRCFSNGTCASDHMAP